MKGSAAPAGRHSCVFLLGLLLCVSAEARADALLIVHSTPDGARLRWVAPQYAPLAGWQVQRRSAGGDEGAWVTVGLAAREPSVDAIDTVLGDEAAYFWALWDVPPAPGTVIDDLAWDDFLGDSDRWGGVNLLTLDRAPRLADLIGYGWLDDSAVMGERYDYRVVSEPRDGSEGEELARRLDVLHNGIADIPPPTGIRAISQSAGVAGRYEIIVEWDPLPTLEEGPAGVVGYYLFRSISGAGGPFEAVGDEHPMQVLEPVDENGNRLPVLDDDGNPVLDDEGNPVPRERVLQYRDLDVEAGRTYFYAAASASFLGSTGPMTAAVSVSIEDLTPPRIPAGLRAQLGADGNSALLVWEASDEPDIAGYTLSWTTAPGAPLMDITGGVLIPPDQTTFTHGPLPPGNPQFHLFAHDLAGNVSRAAVAFVNRPDNEPPPAPADAAAVAQEDHIAITWRDPPIDDLAYIQIFESLLPPSDPDYEPLVIGRADPGEERFERSVAPGQFRVLWIELLAVDQFGNEGPPTAPFEVHPLDQRPPGAPIVAATGGDREIALDWAPPPSSDLAGFHVYRALADGGRERQLTRALLPASTRRYVDRRVQPRVSYRYRVEAVDQSGNASDPQDERGHAQMQAFDATGPEAPKGLTVGEIADQFPLLNWRRPRAADFDHYQVYRAPSAGGPFERIATGLRETNFIDKEFIRYRPFYRVSAVDRFGNEGPSSSAVGFGDAPPYLSLQAVPGKCIGALLREIPPHPEGNVLIEVVCGDHRACGEDEVGILASEHDFGPGRALTIQGRRCADGALPVLPHALRILASHVRVEGLALPGLHVGQGAFYNDVTLHGNHAGGPRCTGPAISVSDAQRVSLVNNSTAQCPTGVSLRGVQDLTFVNNTVVAGGNAVELRDHRGDIELFNNIFVPGDSADGLRIFGLRNGVKVDFGLYFVGGTRAAVELDGIRHDLASWQRASQQRDRHGLSFDALNQVFVSVDPAHPEGFQLRQGSGNPAVRSAAPTPIAPSDQRGRLRDTVYPDRGALERQEN